MVLLLAHYTTRTQCVTLIHIRKVGLSTCGYTTRTRLHNNNLATLGHNMYTTSEQNVAPIASFNVDSTHIIICYLYALCNT